MVTIERFGTLQKALIELGLKENWGNNYAKFAEEGNQSLFVHSLNVFSVAQILGDHLFNLDSEELLVSCLGAFFHDYQKSEDKWQSAAISFMNGNKNIVRNAFDHADGSPKQIEKLGELLEEIKSELSVVGFNNSLDGLAKRILNLVVYTHDTDNHATAVRRRAEVGVADPLVPVVRLADSIASIKKPSEIVNKTRDLDLPQGKNVVFDYHEISMIRGLTTSFLNEAIIELMSEQGYVPLLHFGNGVAYISTQERKDGNGSRKRLEELIDRQVDRFRDSDIYKRGMTNAVIGPLVQTKWPCIQVVREEDVPEIIRYIASMRVTNKDSSEGSTIISKAKESEVESIERFVALTGSEHNPILAKMTSDFFLFVYIAEFIKIYHSFAVNAGRNEEFISNIDTILTDEGIDLTFNEISDVSHTTTLSRRLEVIEKLWSLKNEDLHLNKDSREILVNRFIRVLCRIISEFGDLAPPLLNNEAKQLLLSDINHIPLNIVNNDEVVQLAERTHQRYIMGKNQKKRICNFCGASGVEDAAATLFGDGSQKFSNFIPGGGKIGGGRKAQVCSLCVVESTLRAFFFPSAPAITMVVTPDLSLSPPVSKEWAEGIESFIRSERVGVGPGSTWNMLRVYEALSRTETINNAQTLASMLKPTNKSVNDLAKHLKTQWGDPEMIKYEAPSQVLFNCTFEDIARGYLSGDIDLHEVYLEGFRAPQISQGTAYMTPGHMFFFFRNPLYLNKDESNSTVSIRTYLLALIISKVFHARVMVVDGFQPVLDLSMKGVVRIQVPAPTTMALVNMGISGETHLHKVSETLQKLSALVLISLSYVGGLGKDRLLRLAMMNRGAILRRSELEDWSKITNWQKRRLIELLDVLPAVMENKN